MATQRLLTVSHGALTTSSMARHWGLPRLPRSLRANHDHDDDDGGDDDDGDDDDDDDDDDHDHDDDGDDDDGGDDGDDDDDGMVNGSMEPLIVC